MKISEMTERATPQLTDLLPVIAQGVAENFRITLGSLKNFFFSSPTFTGTASAPTPATTDNRAKIATTAFVRNYLDSSSFLDNIRAMMLELACGQGHAIASGDNLNNYTDPGRYCAKTSAIADSITNKPSYTTNPASRFELTVEYVGATGAIKQTVQYSDGSHPVYTRTRTGDPGTWSSWVKIATENDVKYIVKRYEYSYQSFGPGYHGVTAEDLGMSTPNGYTPVAAAQCSSGHNDMAVESFSVFATGSSNAIKLYNHRTDNTLANYLSGTVVFRVLYMSTALYTETASSEFNTPDVGGGGSIGDNTSQGG